MNVFLPQTNFPARRDPAVDARISASWNFRSDFNSRVLDGPPYANGHTHLGHAVNKILKDFVVRESEIEALYPGWDCHGLPIEWKVEEGLRTKGVNKNDLSVREFRQLCRDFAQGWVDVQREEFKALGIKANWDAGYQTMSPDAEYAILKQLHEVVRNKRLYSALKPVLWSPIEKTALATAETVDREHVVPACYVRFGFVSGPLMGVDALVWTTTPWSLPGNRALAINSSIPYGLYSATGGFVVVAKALAEKFPDMEFAADVSVQDLLASRAANPLYELAGLLDPVDVLDASYVRDTTGTGIVHVGPANSVEDWALYLTNYPGRPVPDLLDEAGRFHEWVPVVGGLLVTKGKKYGPANDAVLAALSDRLYLREDHTMTLQHSWRSDALLIMNATRQFFIDLSGLDVVTAIKNVNFYPESSKRRFLSMTENRPDWLVSRQRLWGTPMALIVDSDDRVVDDERVLCKIVDVLAEQGMDAWWDHPVTAFLPDDYDATRYRKVTDVLDVWFDSACVPVLSACDEPRTVIEGTDQHRGWFSSQMFLALVTGWPVPFENVVTHGFVMHAPGEKMEKSKGTGVSPATIISDVGPDVLRLWVALTNTSQDMVFSKQALKNAEEAYRKIRNTFKYMLGALKDYDFNSSHLLGMELIDEKVFSDLGVMLRLADQAAEEFDFTSYTTLLHRFCVSDLSQFYFDIRKDRLYCDKVGSPARNAYLFVLAVVLDQLLLRFDRITPHLVAEIREHHCETTYMPMVDLSDFLTELQPLLDVRDETRKLLEEARREGKIGASTDAIVMLPLEPSPELAEILIVSEVRFGQFHVMAAKDCGYEKCDRCWKYVPAIDPDSLCPRCATVVDVIP